MKTYRYTDVMGHHYDVPEHLLAEFERRRGILLRIAIIGQSVLLTAILDFAWYIVPVLNGDDAHRSAVNAVWATVLVLVLGLVAFRSRSRFVIGTVLLVGLANLAWFVCAAFGA